MKRFSRLIAAFALAALLLCMLNASAFARKTAQNARFPDGVIEVPQGTAVLIDDDAGTVTITDAPVGIDEGDTFVVYLQDLPIGYTANAVTADGDRTVIAVEKAD